MRVKKLAAPVDVEPPRNGEDSADCVACGTPDDAYVWVSERWRVRAMDRPTGLPMVLILECRSHLDLGDLPNLLAAELGVMTVRLERAIRSLDGVARVHVNRWGDGSAHLHMWFLARPYGQLQLRGTFLSLWDDILPVTSEPQWRENLALVAAWLADFGGKANAEPPHIQWESPSTFSPAPQESTSADADAEDASRPQALGDVEAAESVGLSGSSGEAAAPQSTIAAASGADVGHKTGHDEPESDGGAKISTPAVSADDVVAANQVLAANQTPDTDNAAGTSNDVLRAFNEPTSASSKPTKTEQGTETEYAAYDDQASRVPLH